ncbi:MAG TPA: tlde1 domain-containing protein [Bradyrhizobium sp.]|nr:tlde1 domain-containing protein [Bradyrhizobium sp.]
MSTSTVAYYDFAAPTPRRSAPKLNPQSFLASAAVASLVLGCAWTVYANIFAASPYPQLGTAGFDAPVLGQLSSVALRWMPSAENTRIARLEPPPTIAAPATAPVEPSLSFDERFAAASPQGVAPASQAATSKLAEAPKSQPEPAKLAEAPKPMEAAKPKEAPRLQVAAVPPAPHQTESQPAKPPAGSFNDLAQRAKAAVMSIASNEKQTIFEKLWGKQPSQGSLLSYASADASITGSLGSTQNPALRGSAPYDRSTAVYDISAHTVYLPDGTKLEAHSGLGAKLDDPGSAKIHMRGVTPPHVYELKPREALFHGVPALRLNPIGGEDSIYGRSGLLAHSYMLGPNGDSNGCVSFKDYNAFLNAYRNQGIKRLAVVARVE